MILKNFAGEKRDIDSYNLIKKVIYQTIHIDNMKVLNILISTNDDVPPLYDCLNQRRVCVDIVADAITFTKASSFLVIDSNH